jgi:multidrug resistance protein, MATE family
LRWIDRQRRIWRLAGPVILSNATTPLVGAVDTAVVGRMADPTLIGGVALGSIIISFLFWSFSFLRMGTTGFTAQAWGASDPAELRSAFLRAAAAALAIGLLLLLLQLPLRLLTLALIQGSEGTRAHAATYFDIRIWSAPAVLANYAVLGWLLGTRRTATALGLQLMINGLNMLLAVLLGLGLGWGIRGVAAAAVLSEYLAMTAGLLLVLRRLPQAPMPRLFAREALRRLLRVNGDILLRTLCLQIAFVAFAFAGARLGDLTLAANAILMNLVTIMAFGLDGFAMAAEILVGSAVGARDRAAFRLAVGDSTLWAALLAIAFSLALTLAGGSLIDAFTVHADVRAAARLYLPWLVLTPIVAVWCYQLDGVYIGATRTIEMRNGVAVALAGFLAILLPALGALGNHGLWLALTAFFMLRGATLAVWLPRIDRSLAPVRPPAAGGRSTS